MKPALITALAFAAGATALSAQNPAEQQQRQVRQVIVYGDEPCPVASEGEIIVCARRPETERYRIPEPVRDQLDDDDPASRSWTERARALDETGEAIRGPGSCEPVGPAHHTGCFQEIIDAHRGAREADAEPEPQ